MTFWEVDILQDLTFWKLKFREETVESEYDWIYILIRKIGNQFVAYIPFRKVVSDVERVRTYPLGNINRYKITILITKFAAQKVQSEAKRSRKRKHTEQETRQRFYSVYLTYKLFYTTAVF